MRGPRSRWLPALATTACLLLGHEFALAQTSPPQTAQRSLSKIDPGVIASLTRMGGYVASLTSFEISARMSIDAELANGQAPLEPYGGV